MSSAETTRKYSEPRSAEHFHVDEVADRTSIIMAKTQEDIDRCLRVRYQTYVKERRFEPDTGGLELETDALDEYSVHALVLYEGIDVATVRLIMPETESLPFREVCGKRAVLAPVDWTRTVEISRFAAIRKLSEMQNRSQLIQMTQFCAPVLIKAIFLLMRKHQMKFGVSLAAGALIRMFMLYSVVLNSLGFNVEHVGTRVPSWFDIDDVYSHVKKENPGFFRYVTQITKDILNG